MKKILAKTFLQKLHNKNLLSSNIHGQASLVQVMLVATLLIILMPLVTQLIQDLTKGYSQIETEQKLSLYTLDLRRILSTEGNCENTLNSAGIPTLILNGIFPVTAIENSNLPYVEGCIPNGGTPVPCRVKGGTPPSTVAFGAATVESMRVVTKLPSKGCGSAFPAGDTCWTPSLEITFKKTSPKAVAPIVTREIRLEARADSAGVFKTCFAFLDQAWGDADRFLSTSGGTMTGELIISPPTTVPPSRGLFVQNSFVETNAFYLASDRTLKSDIKPIKNPFEILNGFKGRSFNWKGRKKRDFGFIAQEVERSAPHLVVTDKKTGRKALKYLSLIPVTAEAIKHLHEENQALQKELEELRSEVENLENKSAVQLQKN